MKTVEYEPNGLSTKTAEKRLLEYGENRLEGGKKGGPLGIFLGQFKDLMVMILLVSTVLSAWMGEMVEAVAIVVIVIVNAVLGFVQEYRTEKTLETLKNIAAPMATVLRDGEPTQVHATEVVPGDILLLKAGDRIAADSVVVDSVDLACDEALITGESLPVEKIPSPRPAEATGSSSHSFAYMGTIVTKGRGRAMVVRTGMESEMGKIAGMLDEIEEELTPLQQRLDQLGRFIAVGCLAICAVVSLTGILRGENIFQMVVTGISLAVAAVPEGLPAIVTIALALAVRRILKRNALVRKLHAVEALGCASVICSDKTGTLTENKMTVRELWLDGLVLEVTGTGHEQSGQFLKDREQLMEKPPSLVTLLEAAAACNNSRLMEEREGFFAKEIFSTRHTQRNWRVSGEPTEAALLIAAAKGGIVWEGFDRVREIPFDSTRKMMTVAVRQGEGYRVYSKGAPDYLLGRCTHILTEQGVRPLGDAKRRQIAQRGDEMAGRALRVLGLAYRDCQSTDGELEQGLVFIGLAGMIDPPRREAYDAVSRCRKAKIRPVMITGDHRRTAMAIAQDLGILRGDDLVITGQELDSMDDEALAQVVGRTAVFARVSPGHKLRIVRALKKRGEIVAMTGDGVNDAPAIKEANIGVAMGITGSDVAKEASSIILLDDNFATLVAAIEEGRVIYANIRRFIRYLLSCNTGEVVTMFLGMLMGMPVVLLPIQILLVNLVTDGLPAIALGFEPAPKDIMSRRPRRAEESIFADGLLTTIFFRGCLIGLTTLAVYATFYRLYGGVAVARTGALITLILTQLFHVFECKSEDKSLFQINPFSNPKLFLAVLFSGAVALATVYLPGLRLIFQTTVLTLHQLAMILIFCLCGPLLWAVMLGLQSIQKSRKRESLPLPDLSK